MEHINLLKAVDLFRSEIPALVSKYPTLKEDEKNGEVIVAGDLKIIDSNGKHWETYSVEIYCGDQYPNRFPVLFETSNKIPKIADWHIYEDTLSCCVNVLPQEILRCLEGITLVQYVDEEVIPYLFNQTHRKVEGYYVNGEYGHGLYGLYEFYAKILNTNDIKRIVQLMLMIANMSRPGRTSECFCGSGRKFRYCHRPAFDKLITLGKEILEDHAAKLMVLSG